MFGVRGALDPFPFDMVAYPVGFPSAGVGLILEDDPQNPGKKLIQEKAQPVNAQPQDWSYGSQSPFVERTSALADWALGGGQRQQGDGPMRRYFYCLNCDLSIAGQGTKGLDLVTVAPPGSAGPVTGFAKHTVAGVDRVVALSGTKLLVRTGDAAAGWQTAFTHGVNLLKARRWTPAGGAAGGLFIATESGPYIRYTGTAIVEAPVAMAVNAQTLEVTDEVLWLGKGSKVRKVNADPTLIGSYTAEIQVGDDSASITNMTLAGDVLYIWKPNGIYGLNGDGTSKDLFPGLQLARDANAGKGATVLGPSLYGNVGRGVLRIDGPTAQLESVGPDRLVENTSEVQGRVVGMAFHNSWFMYTAIYNESNGATYINKFGAWLNPDTQNAASWEFAEVWHLGVRKISGKMATSIAVLEVDDQPRLYIGWNDGSISYGILPKNTPSPLSDPACRFTTDDGYIYFPMWHGNWMADDKDIVANSVFGPFFDASNYAEFLLSNNPVSLPAVVTSGQVFDATPGGRIDLTSIETYGRLMRFGVKLVSAANTATPVISGAAVHFRVRPKTMLTIQGQVRAVIGMFDRAYRPYRYAPGYIRDVMRAIASEIEPSPLLLPDGRLVRGGVNVYAEHTHTDRNGRGIQGWSFPFIAVEYKPIGIYGTVGRLNVHTVGELSTYTVGGLQNI